MMNMYLYIILTIIIGGVLLEWIVEGLNLRAVSTTVPKEFREYYPIKDYQRAQEYLKDNTRFELISSFVITCVLVICIVTGLFDILDRTARSLSDGPIITGLVFTAMLGLLSQVFTIPLSAYHVFVIEEKYGFNRTDVKTFVLDILKSWVLMVLVGGLVLGAVLWFFEWAGSLAWLYCWIVVLVFQFLLMYIAPVIFLPLFNRFTPLEDGVLKTAIECYANEQQFQLKGIYTMDGSKRSTKSNAFFTGFGRFRRIVLFDTLIENHTTEELVSVLAHEMGHYKKKHILKQSLLSIVGSGMMFYILSFFINHRGLFDAFGMTHTSIYASLIFFGFLYSPIAMILSTISNAVSRRFEYEADRYAKDTYEHPKALSEALKKLSVHNLSNLKPHPLKVFLEYSHPPVLERIKALSV